MTHPLTPSDIEFAKFLKAVLWDRGNEGHTTRGQSLIVKPRKPKRSLLTGKLK